MAHPITRLTPGSTFKRPDDPPGGIPEFTVQEVATAAGSIRDLISYHAVMAYHCQQYPTAESWPELMLEIQSLVVRQWAILSKTKRAPKSMKLDTIHQIAAGAWHEFVGPKPKTQKDQAKIADVPYDTFRKYAILHNATVTEIHDKMEAGLRYVKRQIGDG